MGSESFGAYVPRTPTKRLDHALRFRKRGDERRAGEKKAASAAIVLAGLARGEDGAPLSDHAPIFAVVRR
jgi:hypothetical protein